MNSTEIADESGIIGLVGDFISILVSELQIHCCLSVVDLSL